MDLKFEWDKAKEQQNFHKHGLEFTQGTEVFRDSSRLILQDTKHSAKEARYFCIGKTKDGILTVRFTYRNGVIRIFGVGKWRRGKQIYENKKTNI